PLVVSAVLLSTAGFAQDKYLPSLLKESMKNSRQFKSGIVGSYPRHTEEYLWNETWVLNRTIETSYTTFGQPAVIEYRQGEGLSRRLFSYNDQHNETEMILQNKAGDAWINSIRTVTIYEAANRIQEYRTDKWTGTVWEISDGSQISYETDGDRVTVMTSKAWNSVTSTWDYSMRETYTYSGAGSNYATSITEMWDNGWVNMAKYEITWTGNDITQTINYAYDGGTWVMSGKTVYEFLEYDSLVMTSYSYVGPDTWMGTTRITSTNDSYGNEIFEQVEMYMMAWTVFSASQCELTYVGNNLTQRIRQTFSMFSPVAQGDNLVTWINESKEVFSNFASMGTDVTLLPDAGIRIFPNPAGQEVLVRMSMLKTGVVTLTLFNTTGQKILEENITTNGSDINYQMNLHWVSPGTYILTARDKQGTEIGKTRLIKE
ncbi:MAG: T9SS type A sorting domain-containing protein, partial [Bacteroidales bacterium]|nr:T9SS type A sorting domain-containing protein [Bacteroidales bacterium]